MEYTFKITISACAHHTWQGVLQTETGSHPFMNELELLDAQEYDELVGEDEEE